MKTKQSSGYTVSDLIDDYFNEHVFTLKNQSAYVSRIKKYTLPGLGSLDAKNVSEQELRDFLSDVRSKSNSNGVMNDVARFSRSMWNWAETTYKLSSADNPFNDLKLSRERNSRDNFYSMEGLRMVINNPDNITIDRPKHLLFIGLVLNGNRINELLGSEKSEFNFKSRIWTIPTGRIKNKKEFQLPFWLCCL